MNGLVVADVRREFDGRAVLDGIDLRASAGETVAILGPSGSGKSTLLNIVGSLDRPTSGSVTLDGVEVTALRGDDLAAYRAERVGFVFQDHNLLPQLTALENAQLPTLAVRRPGAEERARDLLERVGVAHRADALPARLSGGERQRVAIARAMLMKPGLLLCDEPTGNLDRDAGAAVVSLLLDLAAAEGSIVLMVTHNPEHAARFARAFEMRDGRLEAVETAPAGARP